MSSYPTPASSADPPGAGWSLVVPLKPLALAKSRLADSAGELRPALALAFAQDTVAAALRCPAVAQVTVVTDDGAAGEALVALGARVVPDLPGKGLNAALSHGEEQVRAMHPAVAVAALSADLPALRPEELGLVLSAAAGSVRAFLADAAGVGTTLLTAGPGCTLRPGFGGASRDRHRSSGAREITLLGVESVRRDVDTDVDLRTALRMGTGPHTAAVLNARAWSGRWAERRGSGGPRLGGMQATAYTYSPETRSGSVLLDDGTPVPFDSAAFDAGGLRMLRPGQRVRVRTEGEGEDRRIVFLTLHTFPDPAEG